MHATNDRDQFAPPRPPGRMRAVALAVLAHVALIGALTWGVNWKTSADQPAVEAELWAPTVQQAAPREVAPPPPPAPVPEPPRPTPAPPAPPPPPPPPKAEPDTREADIALEREKKRLAEEKKEREQQAEREKRERERKEKLEQDKKERLQKEKAEREKTEKAEKAAKEKAEREKAEKAEKAEKERKDKAEKAEQDKKKQADDKRKAEADAKRIEALRQENLRRIAGMAGATGGETATGNAQRSAGPSGSYGGKVAAKVRPNIVYPDAVSGNPRAEVEVRASPDGTIVNVRLSKSSGNPAWDEAVVRALHKTDTLPRDVDGRVPSSLTIGFSPKD